MLKQFMDEFTYRDSASRQVQLFIKLREFSSDQPAPSNIFPLTVILRLSFLS